MLKQEMVKVRKEGADRQITVDDKVRQEREGSKFGDLRILGGFEVKLYF